MSEYWVSNKRYWCKYCGISIADDVPSRQQHEGGLRHKGNVERFIRNIYKTGEKRKKEAAEEARDMERIEKAAQAAFHNDVGAGHAKMSDSSLPSTSKAPAVKKPAAKPSNPFANYTTAQSLGYTDPEEELAKTRQTQGVVGEWQFIAPTASASPAPEENPVVSDLKRPAEGDEDGRSFKLRKKTVNLGDVYDPGVITIKPRVKKEESPAPPASETVDASKPATSLQFTSISLKKAPTEPSAATASSEPATESPAPEASQSNGASKWTKSSWGAPIEDTPVDYEDLGKVDAGPAAEVKKEEAPSTPLDGAPSPTRVGADAVKKEEEPAAPPPAPSGGSLFKKRKAAPSAGARGGRRF